MKALQKEFNASSVTLGRSFATADEIIFREAVQTTPLPKVYKGLAAIHEAFGQLGDMAQEIANGTNASRELPPTSRRARRAFTRRRHRPLEQGPCCDCEVSAFVREAWVTLI